MAVQTIILRPNGQPNVGNPQAITRVPSDTADENLYQLFNEAVADDDATYVSSTSSLAIIGLAFSMEQIAGIIPTDIRLVVRMKSETALWKTSFFVTYIDSEGNNSDNWTYLANESLDVYETLYGTLTNFETLKNRFATAQFKIAFSAVESGLEKSGNPFLTQLYLEVDYDDEVVSDEEVQFYLKQSGVWQSVSGEVYKKINGVWATSTLDELSAGDQIVVVEHN